MASDPAVSPPDPAAAAAIRQFVARPDLALVDAPGLRQPPGAAHRTFLSTDRQASFTVDATGQVVEAQLEVGFLRLAAPAERRPAALPLPDRAQALAEARAFLAARIGGFDQLSLLTEATEDRGADEHGQPIRSFRFEWGERLGAAGARGIRSVAVSIDPATGSLTSFLATPQVSLTVSVEPTISRDEALAIAERQFGAPVVASTIELGVWYKDNDRSQPQVLRWLVRLESDEPARPGSPLRQYAAIIVDAHSGAIISDFR